MRRVHGTSEDVVDGLGDHHGGGHIRFHVEDGAGGLENRREGCVLVGGLVGITGDADGGVESGEVEVVFEGEGEAVERAYGSAFGGEVVVTGGGCDEGAGEAGFGEAVRLISYVSLSSLIELVFGSLPAGEQLRLVCKRLWLRQRI